MQETISNLITTYLGKMKGLLQLRAVNTVSLNVSQLLTFLQTSQILPSQIQFGSPNSLAVPVSSPCFPFTHHSLSPHAPALILQHMFQRKNHPRLPQQTTAPWQQQCHPPHPPLLPAAASLPSSKGELCWATPEISQKQLVSISNHNFPRSTSNKFFLSA